MAYGHRDPRQFQSGNNGFQGFRRWQPLGIGGAQIDYQTYRALCHDAQAANPESANFDFSRKFIRAAHEQLAVADRQANTVVAN